MLSETGEAVEALDLCRRALERPSLTRATRAALNRQIALIQMLRGEGDAAIAAFGAAILLTDDDMGRGIIHLNRGNVRLQRDELNAAGADFEEAERSFLAAGDTYAAAKAVHNLGYVQFRRGELISALGRMDQARGEFTSQAGPAFVAMVEQDRAEVLLAAGLRDDSIEALRSASAAYGRRRLHQRRGEAELALAHAAVDQPRVARAAARRAVDLFERSNAPSWRARAAAEELAADIELRRTTNLVERGDRLVDELEGHRLHWDGLGVRLRVVGGLLDTGAIPEAGRRLRAIRMTSAAPLWLRLEDRDVRARGAQATGRRTAALQHVRTGLDELHAWQSSFGSLDLQTNVVGHGVRLAVRGLSLAVDSRSDAVLFEWSERARMLASRIQPVRAPQDPQTVTDLAELRAEPAPEREAELRRRIRERAWQHRGSGAVSDPVPLADLQAALGPEAALIAYVVTMDRVVVLVVTDEGTQRHDLGDRDRLQPLLSGLLADLDMAATELPPSLANSVRGALADRLTAVADVLVAPLLSDLGARRVVLTPSGVLAGLPWSLLPGLAGRPVLVAQSATSWLARRSTPLRTRSAGFVAGPRVARAELEVRGAAKAWSDAPVLAGADATAAAVSDLAGREQHDVR